MQAIFFERTTITPWQQLLMKRETAAKLRIFFHILSSLNSNTQIDNCVNLGEILSYVTQFSHEILFGKFLSFLSKTDVCLESFSMSNTRLFMAHRRALLNI